MSYDDIFELALRKGYDFYYLYNANLPDDCELFYIQKWLQEKYRIIITLFPYSSGKHKWIIWRWVKTGEETGKWEEYLSRIETKEEAVYEALKLIICI
jgi:hypothetical protein